MADGRADGSTAAGGGGAGGTGGAGGAGGTTPADALGVAEAGSGGETGGGGLTDASREASVDLPPAGGADSASPADASAAPDSLDASTGLPDGPVSPAADAPGDAPGSDAAGAGDGPVDMFVATDSAEDVTADVSEDLVADAEPDLAGDAPPDVEIDLAADLPADLPDDLPADLPADLEPDLAVDLPADMAIAGTIKLSEIMYHPVLENDYEDQHEFIELANTGPVPLDISGYKLAGEVTFTFPAGTVVPANGFLVVAKNKTALLGVSAYALNAQDVVGDYTGQLDNGGGTLQLLDGASAVVDEVTYDDRFPWPVAADAFGAGQTWLGANLLPLSSHQYRGVSLERVSLSLPTAQVSNWVPSPLDGMTPGRANNVTGTPPPIVETIAAIPAGGQSLIRSSDTVTIRAGFSPYGTISNVRVEYFVDNLDVTSESKIQAVMNLNGSSWEATLPAQSDNKIIRYRILADKGAGLEVISPRPSDPYPFHAYFVSPVVSSAQPPYQMFLSAASWGQLWTNINFNTDDRRVVPESIGGNTVRCKVRESWDGRVFGVFVYLGEVYDVRVRYQGSRYNRPAGNEIDLSKTNINPLPSPMMTKDVNGNAVNILRALSWNVDWPRYKRFEGRETAILNKLNQSCPGLDQAVAERLYQAAGVPVSRTRYRRLYINGGYYDYSIDLEPIGQDVIDRFTPAGTRIGDLFKASGLGGTEGPWGQGDARPLDTSCSTYSAPWTPLARYAYTYERKTWDWKDHSDLKTFIDALDVARASSNLNDADWANDNLAPVRTFLDQNLDVETMLNYFAIRQWAEPWDDVFHNHYVYKNAAGRWAFLPWDVDREFGEHFGWNANRSFYLGLQLNGHNRDANWNRLKDAFMRAYQGELNARLQYLATYDVLSADPKKGILSPTRFRAAVAEAAATFDKADWAASPVTNLCNFDTEKTNLETFGDNRDAALAEGLCPAVGGCGLKGEYFDDLSFDSGQLKGTRLDPTVDFDWGGGNPGMGMGNDTFQTRWTGKVLPAYAESYTFYVNGDDGVRLWVNGTQIINDWKDGSSERSGTITFTVGQIAQPIDVRLEFYERNGGAKAILSWSSPSRSKQVIPASRLRPQ